MTKEQSTFLKGIAVILVLVSHLIGGGYNLRVFTPFGGIGVALFLILSGYGMNESYYHSGLHSFWWKKVIRIGLPWLIWCSIFFVISSVESVWKVQFLIRYWYLEYLVIWCLLFWLGRSILHDNQYLPMVFAVLSVVMFIVFPNLQAEQSLSFLTGIIMSERVHKVDKSHEGYYKRLTVFLPFLFFAYATVFLMVKQLPVIRAYGEESLIMKFVQLNIKLPYALSILLFYIKMSIPRWVDSLIMPIGLLSLELYLVQMMFFASIHGSFTRLLFVMVAIIGLSVILHFLVGKANKLLNRITISI